MSQPAHRPEPISAHVAMPRRCLACGDDFDSAWSGERICPGCKESTRFGTAAALPDQYR